MWASLAGVAKQVRIGQVCILRAVVLQAAAAAGSCITLQSLGFSWQLVQLSTHRLPSKFG